MSIQYYKQCMLERPGDGVKVLRYLDVARIPEQFAVVGKWLKIKGVDHWKVTGVSDERFTTAQCDDAHHNIKNQRKASDI